MFGKLNATQRNATSPIKNHPHLFLFSFGIFWIDWVESELNIFITFWMAKSYCETNIYIYKHEPIYISVDICFTIIVSEKYRTKNSLRLNIFCNFFFLVQMQWIDSVIINIYFSSHSHCLCLYFNRFKRRIDRFTSMTLYHNNNFADCFL